MSYKNMNLKHRTIVSLAFVSILHSCVGFSEKSELTFNPNSINPLLAESPIYSYQILKDNIFQKHCIKCHGPTRAEPAGDPIDLSSFKIMMKSRFIPLLKKGRPQKSRLFTAVRDGEMPPDGRLKDYEIDYLGEWIQACAPESPTDTIPVNCDEN